VLVPGVLLTSGQSN